MKNFEISARVSVNGCVPVNGIYRLHDGKLFWHSCPKKYAQEQHNGFVKQNNACLGDCKKLDERAVRSMTLNYLANEFKVDRTMVQFVEIAEPRELNARGRKPAEPKTTNETPKAPKAPKEEPKQKRTKGASATAKETPQPTTTPKAEPKQRKPSKTTEPKGSDATPQPTTPKAPEPAQTTDNATDALAAFANMVNGLTASVAAQVLEQLRPIIAEQVQSNGGTTTTIKVVTPKATNEVKGHICNDFGALVQTLAEGEYVYLYGPAGCGKSYTAQQLAEALGLPFYSMQQVLYEHQVVGFVDANGTRHETPFSEAYQNGGLVLLDEFDGSSEEAAIVINNALANGVLNLPGVGNVKMHENFRVVAAGNTTMTGADIMYTARRVLDASTIDRFWFERMDYDEQIELANANGDQSIVDFAHDVRKAIESAGLYALFSYRAIKRLGNENLQKVWGDERLLQAAFVKSLGHDEVRLIYGRLTDKNNRWAKALSKLA